MKTEFNAFESFSSCFPITCKLENRKKIGEKQKKILD
jgi:hypothetical protein